MIKSSSVNKHLKSNFKKKLGISIRFPIKHLSKLRASLIDLILILN